MPTLPMKQLTIDGQTYEVEFPNEVDGDLVVSGNLTANDHTQRIGYMPNSVSENVSIESGSNWVDSGIGMTLSAGTWILIANIEYEVNATGYRGIAIGGSSIIGSSRWRTKAIGSYKDNLHTSALVQPTTSTTYSVRVQQSSGSALSATITLQAARIV